MKLAQTKPHDITPEEAWEKFEAYATAHDLEVVEVRFNQTAETFPYEARTNKFDIVLNLRNDGTISDGSYLYPDHSVVNVPRPASNTAPSTYKASEGEYVFTPEEAWEKLEAYAKEHNYTITKVFQYTAPEGYGPAGNPHGADYQAHTTERGYFLDLQNDGYVWWTTNPFTRFCIREVPRPIPGVPEATYKATLMDNKTLDKRLPDCGHVVAPHACCQDAVYDDTLCLDCMAARTAALKRAGTYGAWKAGQPQTTLETTSLAPITPMTPGDYLLLSSLEEDPLRDPLMERYLADGERFPEHFKPWGLPVLLTDGYDAARELPVAVTKAQDGSVTLASGDLAFPGDADGRRRFAAAWLNGCDRAAFEARDRTYRAYALPDVFLNAVADLLGDGIATVAGTLAPGETQSLHFQVFPTEMPHTLHTAQVEPLAELGARVAASTTVVLGENGQLKWSGTAWRAAPNYWVTCAHVVNVDNRPPFDAKSTSILLRNGNGGTVPARVAFINYDMDAAILEIDPVQMPGMGASLPLGTSLGIYPMMEILTVGAPEGVEQVVTHGYVATTERHIADIPSGVFFADIHIYPGSSGGPVVNAHGEVIGIARGSYMRSDETQGLNYCVAIDPIKAWLWAKMAHG